MKMRTREEIQTEIKKIEGVRVDDARIETLLLLLEVMLDIREILNEVRRKL